MIQLKFPNGNTQLWNFLLVLDKTSRFIYTHSLNRPTQKEVKEAFEALFKQHMPKFPLVKTDRANLFINMKPFFAKHHMLWIPTRGIHHLSLLEPTMRFLKSKIIRYLHVHPSDYSPGGLAKILESATDSINSTESVHGMTPKQVIFLVVLFSFCNPFF